MAARVFRRGDVVHLDFDPQSGREMKGNHYALVISNDLFNKSGMCMVCPITQGSYHRDGGFTTTLMGTGMDTQGVVVASEVKILDLVARKASFKERCDEFVTEEVLAKVCAILS